MITYQPRHTPRYQPRHSATRCARCSRPAESPRVSVFRLCVQCADDLYPGANVYEYARLRELYGHATR